MRRVIDWLGFDVDDAREGEVDGWSLDGTL